MLARNLFQLKKIPKDAAISFKNLPDEGRIARCGMPVIANAKSEDGALVLRIYRGKSVCEIRVK